MTTTLPALSSGRTGRTRGRHPGQLARRRRVRWLFVFVGPAVALYTAVIVYPLMSAFSYSLFSWRGVVRDSFTGLTNFTALFSIYPYRDQVPAAFWHNVLFFVGTMAVQNTAGLGLALLLHTKPMFKRLFQTLYSLPYLISPLVIGYLWTLMLAPNYGSVNALFQAVGLDSLSRPWLGDPTTALPVLVLVNAWQWIGCPMLIFGAALGGIPQEYHEAAKIDGAGPVRTLWSVTLPLLTPAIGVVTVLTFVGCFNVFDLVYALGGSSGSPAGSTDVLGLLFYRLAFGGARNAIGLSSALAVMLFGFVLGVSLVLNRVLRRREERLS